jgi:glycosyltransferase involved in cell wall biosynthesis
MGFASAYLEQRALFPEIIKEAVDDSTGIIVVVPAYNEPGITRLLDSLTKCVEPGCRTEVIIVINAPDDATDEILENNRITLKNIESWKNENTDCFFRLFAFIIEHPTIKGWGVGLARKTGMDEAIRRFNSIDRPNGVILNIDADCTVSQNYFLAVYHELLIRSDCSACSICFEHPLSGTDYPVTVFNYIALYELHLRYYFQGLEYSGFPYVFHTVGSAVAVKAIAYIKAGGMNRRQAGEDFYFIQKLVPSGGYFNLNSTVVYPSPRASNRVPFGTGASIAKLTIKEGSTLLTYNMLAFNELHTFFKLTDVFFDCGTEELQDKFRLIPDGLRLFLNEKEWIGKITEIKKNTSGRKSFKKRFFGWFNMFRIVKYLNFVHTHHFEKKPVEIAALELLQAIGVSVDSGETKELLLFYRRMEKTGIS